MKITRLILGILGVLVVSSPAQTNFTIVTRTNIFRAAPNFREVNGQLYNTSFSKLWKIQTGKILEVQENGVVLQTFTTNRVYQNVLVKGRGMQVHLVPLPTITKSGWCHRIWFQHSEFS